METNKNENKDNKKMLQVFWANFFKAKEKKDFISLKNCPLFSDLSKWELHFMRKVLHKRLYTNGEIVFKSRSNAGMYLILKGGVNVLQGTPDAQEEPALISSLKPGDFFGELALVNKTSYDNVFIQANQNSQFLAFYQPDLDLVIEKRPQIGIKILKRLSNILSVRLKKAEQKILHTGK